MELEERNPATQEELIRFQEAFDRSWTRYFRLSTGGGVAALLICLLPMGDMRLIVALILLFFVGLLCMQPLTCPRCRTSLMQFHRFSKPRFCPRCGVSFTGFPSA